MKDFNLKLLSLAIALLLAFFVHSGSNSSQVGFIVPIEVTSIPPGKILVKPLTAQAQVTIKGPSFLVSQIPLSPPIIKVRVPADVDDHFVASLRQPGFPLPPSVQVVSVEPAEIELFFDDLVTREVPVVVPRIGALPNNLVLERLDIVPDHLMLRGPAHQLKQIERVETEPLDLREVNDNFSSTLNIRLPGAMVEPSATRIQANAQIATRQIERRFSNLTVEVRGQGSKAVTISPSSVNVEVSGPRAQLKDLKEDEVVPYVRLARGGEASGTAKVQVDLPQGMALVQIEPDEVQVEDASKAKPAAAANVAKH